MVYCSNINIFINMDDPGAIKVLLHLGLIQIKYHFANIIFFHYCFSIMIWIFLMYLTLWHYNCRFKVYFWIQIKKFKALSLHLSLKYFSALIELEHNLTWIIRYIDSLSLPLKNVYQDFRQGEDGFNTFFFLLLHANSNDARKNVFSTSSKNSLNKPKKG